jgi:RNA polymerase sigma-70 factor (ECF subfamily)
MVRANQVAVSNGQHEPAASDRQAFEALFRGHYASLCEYVYPIVRSREVTEELVQDLFVRLWERRARAAPESLAESYLYRAARNRALGYLRRERVARRWAEHVRRGADVEPHALTGDTELGGRELAAAVERAIDALPERCRLIFLMSRQQGLSYGEIARSLNVSLSTVETQMSRALKRLRQQLAPFLSVILLALGVLHASAIARSLVG